MNPLRKRTPAERAAIDARAKDWPRPLTLRQQQALASMRKGPLAYVRITRRWGDSLGTTIFSLVARGLCRIEGRQRPRACITGAGRKVLG